MPRGPRYLPPGWSVEVTTRTICGFYLLPATPAFARIIVGVLVKAQELYPVKVHAAVAANNHYHLILTPKDEDELGDFMEYFNGNLAREAGRPLGWHAGLKRYDLSASVVRSAQRTASRRVAKVSESRGCPFSVIRARYRTPCFVCRFSMLAMANASCPVRGDSWGTQGAALANKHPLPAIRSNA